LVATSRLGEHRGDSPILDPAAIAVSARRVGAAAASATAIAFAFAAPALAGPPYLTDDAEPTDLGHWEIYHFVIATHVPGETDGETGMDLNFGAAPDLQLTAVIPLAFQDWDRGGAGSLELAAKYKILHQSDGGWTPDLAVFPRLFTPASSQRFGSTRFSLLLPVWAEKDWGKWSVFGGGGYTINPGPDQRSFWQGGIGVSRAIGARWSLGGEVFWQGASADDARAFAAVNVGATYKLSDHWTLMGSVGPALDGGRAGGAYDFYAALEATY
jgi:hypothetical protein